MAELGVEAETNFSAVLELLEVSPRHHWLRPQFDVLHGYPGMGEIIFNGDRKTYRVFGFFGPSKLQFTLLSGHIKKRNLDHEMKLAEKRMKFAIDNPEIIYELAV